MGSRHATIIVESRLLFREALKSLMAESAYRIVNDGASSAEISGASTISDEPKLVILGAQTADAALTEAVAIRELWPDSKIISLYEYASPADFQRLLTSQIDGCVPLFVSPDTLISTLDLIMAKDVRVMVLGDAKRTVIQSEQPEKSHPSNIKMDKLQSAGAEHEHVSFSIGAEQHTQPPANGASASNLNVNDGGAQCVPPLRNLLSEREAQILDGLVKGHANKVIARTCDMAVATVKVHMKSILRKIQVVNRTQAAIWALEHGFAVGRDRDRTKVPAGPPLPTPGVISRMHYQPTTQTT